MFNLHFLSAKLFTSCTVNSNEEQLSLGRQWKNNILTEGSRALQKWENRRIFQWSRNLTKSRGNQTNKEIWWSRMTRYDGLDWSSALSFEIQAVALDEKKTSHKSSITQPHRWQVFFPHFVSLVPLLFFRPFFSPLVSPLSVVGFLFHIFFQRRTVFI